MNVHEHQAKALLSRYGVFVPKGYPAFSISEAVEAADKLPGPVYVVKAQIHAGGRGKGGGVKVVKSRQEVESEAQRMLGMTLVTHQTGPEGKEVGRLYVEDGCDIARELYLSMLVDRGHGRVVVVASTEGGMDIEEVAAESPEKIKTIVIDPAVGMSGFQARRIAFELGLEGQQVGSAVKLMMGMFEAFQDLDANM
ncbi:MAG: ATP-grasp domain-containing protein, partial [Alphaproteobacteria bacterium]